MAQLLCYRLPTIEVPSCDHNPIIDREIGSDPTADDTVAACDKDGLHSVLSKRLTKNDSGRPHTGPR